MKKILFSILLAGLLVLSDTSFAQLPDQAASRRLNELQQKFVDLRFGMFIHFNIPTYANADWPDPLTPPSVFNPQKLDANQWARAAKSANMSYGCLTTKHHSGFCIWDTKTTSYSVMNSPYKKDVVRQFVDAFRANGLKVMLYYSILDTHHELRPNKLTAAHIQMVKQQITELLTNYGKIEALVIDGWDAPWSRITYDQIPFADIYSLVKQLQPDCLIMDLNGAKYPAEGLYYTDIKTYEMGAGQRMSKDARRMPSLACLPINSAWFWKTDFPTAPVRDPQKTIDELIRPLNENSCNFILNVAPNRDGLIDENALAALKAIGTKWTNEGPTAKLDPLDLPVTSSNIAIHQPANSSWSNDMDIMDFANDDDYKTSWQSHPSVKEPWLEIQFNTEKAFNCVVIAEAKTNIEKYRIDYWDGTAWKTLVDAGERGSIHLHRFSRVWSSRVRVTVLASKTPAAITELQVFDERR
ncbi:MAG: carbohydrate-binding protein [Chitinophagaceae bacterium]|nr:MAG: carbohydrate-binding protein [Chitinophagaceae bacterium]